MKKGFVLLESIIVLMIVTLSLSVLLASYALVSRKTREKEYYDLASDKYLLYNISQLGTTNKNSYSKMSNVSITTATCSEFGKITDTTNSMYTTDQFVRSIFGNSDKCGETLKSVGLKHLYVVNDISAALGGVPSEKPGTLEYQYSTDKYVPIIETTPNKIYDNGTILYMKTLRKCYANNVVDGNVVDNAAIGKCTTQPVKYLIGVFYRNEKYYFASIEL